MIGSPFCAIDIYPFEGGHYSMLASEGNSTVLSCQTSHSVKGDAGTFAITLAPGGPDGVDGVSWTQIITPLSFCVIAFQRLDHSFVDMVGVITSIQETQSWAPASNVTRVITITGYDFGYFFTQFNWANLAFVGNNTLAGQAAYIGLSPGFGAILSKGLLAGTPESLAALWYSDIMMASNGVLGKTFVPYQGQQIGVSGATLARIDQYPAYAIPITMNYMSEDSTWTQKFRQILPFPVYEWFVGSGPSGIWGPTQSEISDNGQNYKLPSGYAFKSSMLPQAQAAYPQMIGRINPQPHLTVAPTAPNGNYQFTGVNTQNFNALTFYQLEDGGFIRNTIQFGAQDIRNLYILNPTSYNMAVGGDKAQPGPMFFQFSMLHDAASIHRYGYMPYPFTTYWFNDAAFQQPLKTTDTFQNTIADVNSRLASYYEPNPLMGNGTVLMEMRPDIFAGNVFEYAPFKYQLNGTWLFYIEAVQHSYVFGGPSTTELTLSRGLPASVYADAALLQNILQGNAIRKNGQYVSGQVSGLGTTLDAYTLKGGTQWLSEIASIYVNPQAK